MKVARKLALLEESAKWSFRRSVRKLPDVKRGSDREVYVSPLVVNLLNSWADFVRTYYVSCALGARTSSGRSVSSSLTGLGLGVNDVIGRAVLLFKPAATVMASGLWDTRDEPAWHDANTLMRLARDFAFTNRSDIDAAFSFGFTAHRNMVVFRNYYAHRNQGTRAKAQRLASGYSIRTNQHPTDVILDVPLSSPGLALIDVWISELDQTVELLCQ